MRAAAILLAALGTCFLALVSVKKEPQLVKAGRITPMMNRARVRASGTVERNAYVSDKTGQTEYLSFYLDDGTGSLRAAAHAGTASAIISSGRLPSKGDRVEITGSLRISDGKPVTLQLEKTGIRWKQ